MIQQVSSAEPLDKVSYFRRGDGLADIRVRKNITQVEHPADGEQAGFEELPENLGRRRTGVQAHRGTIGRTRQVQPRQRRGRRGTLHAAARG